MDAASVESQSMPQKSRSFIPIIVTIIGLTVGAGALIARMGRKAVMADWANRRCEVPIMFAGSFYKPDSDPRTPGKFSADNFSYCIKQMQKTAMGAAFAAPLALFDKQIAAAKTVAESQNADKLGIANLLKGVVGQILGDFYKRLRIFADQLSRIMQRFRMSYDRLAGAVNSIALAGLSMMQGIFNAYNTVILVVIIILSIIAGVFILFFFTLFPFIPMLMSAVAVLAGAGYAVGGLADVFCFAPDTQVEMADGGQRPIAELQLGDELAGGGFVQGMYVMDGSWADMYSLNGVIVSGDHLVWNDEAAAYCAVAAHPDARRPAAGAAASPERVYCPLISNRSILAGGHWFRDWEEIEESSEGRWHSLIAGMLGSYAGQPESLAAGFTENILVFSRKLMRWVPINFIEIGDAVMVNTKGDFTPVLGKTVIEGDYYTNCEMGPATWVDSADGWKHPAVNNLEEGHLYNLITKLGTFIVFTGKEIYTVRDAFEVGIERIHETYEFTARELKKTESRPPNR